MARQTMVLVVDDDPKQLVIARKTVSSHVQRILAKLDVHTRAQAVAVAYESGLIRIVPKVPEVEAHLALPEAEADVALDLVEF